VDCIEFPSYRRTRSRPRSKMIIVTRRLDCVVDMTYCLLTIGRSHCGVVTSFAANRQRHAIQCRGRWAIRNASVTDYFYVFCAVTLRNEHNWLQLEAEHAQLGGLLTEPPFCFSSRKSRDLHVNELCSLLCQWWLMFYLVTVGLHCRVNFALSVLTKCIVQCPESVCD
jgi:hypothetical protein